jgi:hypothetical protein
VVDADSAVVRKQPRPDADMVPPLEKLVTPEQYNSLQQLALTYKQTLSHDPQQQVDLGEWVWLVPVGVVSASGCG